MTNTRLRNRAEVDFISLSQGTIFLFNDDLYITVELFEDETWTNAVKISGTEKGHRCNFSDNVVVIPLQQVYIDYEI